MDKKRSLGVNAALNAFKSGLAILFPLITYPYVFRVLHTEGVGKVNYAASIISYFALIAALGFPTYAVREGAKLREQPEKLGCFCNQIFTANIITTVFAYGALLVALVFLKPLREYRVLLLVSSLSIAFATFSVDWINTIFEDFLYITIRSIVTYALSLILLFVLVKSEDDYLKYAFLTVATSGIVCILNWIYCRKYVRVKITRRLNLKNHSRSVLRFFANSVATSIYVNSDITMLGYFSGDHAVGLYALAVKVYNVVKTMLAAMYTVAIPRLSFFVGQNDTANVKKLFTTIFSSLTIVLLPAGVGLAVIAREVVLIMGGPEYLDATFTLQILSIALVGAIFGGAVTYCLNIPLGREKYNVRATVMSALLNLVCNVFMIPLFKHNGAAITTAVAEFFVLFYSISMFENIVEYLDIKAWRRSLMQALIGCIMILIVAIAIKCMVENAVVRISLIIAISILLYGIELVITKNELAGRILQRLNFKKQ